ncbi:MAG: LytR C-terminal domain-containing protein [Candidatus Zixiibacteriota bacterium]|nr:MAG: LytR C-terminal domain-containing protein [candidate division Zixibacteria bacterium]
MSALSTKRKVRFNRIFAILLVVLAAITIFLVVSMTVRVTRGVSKTVESPEYLVRLEILNGCRQPGIAAKTAALLSEYRNDEIEIRIIATGDFDLRTVRQSFLVSRDKDKRPTEMLAKTLGMEPSSVVYQPLENNYRQVSATLVLGEDFESIRPVELAYKE